MNYIFTNARIHAVETGCNGDSLLVRDGRISCIGSLSDCRAQVTGETETIDLGGRALLPAFTDIHTHFNEFARQRYQIELNRCVTITEVRDTLDAYRKRFADLPDWILGGGWDKNRLDAPELIRKELLDEFFPQTPVTLWSKDYHTRWCNTAALRVAGITSHTSDPAGGKIVKDADGEPNGILLETAADNMKNFIVPLSASKSRQALREAASDLYRLGLVGIHSMEAEAGAAILQSFAAEDKMLRICRHFYLDDFTAVQSSGVKSLEPDPWYRVGGLKLFADGALGSQTAAMFDAYPDSGGNRGILRHNEDELTEFAREADRAGFPCVIHAIGDLAVHTVINALINLKREEHNPSLLHRIEHVQAIADEDIPRLRESGAFCSVQPVHLANDVDMIEKQWAPVRERAYRFRDLWDAGIAMGFGSDAPIETINPFHGIYSAIQRRKALSPLTAAWMPAQGLTAPEAIYGYTAGAAIASKSINEQGSIKVGKNADLIVLEDFNNLPHEYWLDARSLLTMLDGRIVWRDGV